MSSYFYNKEVYTTIKTKDKNNKGQIIVTYKKDSLFKADIQPITEKSKKINWGINLSSTKEMYADIELKVGDIIIYKSRTYEIEARVEWDTYSIYALKEVDVNVN